MPCCPAAKDATGSVEVAKAQLIPAIHDLVKQNALCIGNRLRTQNDEVLAVIDESVQIPRRQFQIHDCGICGTVWIDPRVNDPGNDLVRAGASERRAAIGVVFLENLEAFDVAAIFGPDSRGRLLRHRRTRREG